MYISAPRTYSAWSQQPIHVPRPVPPSVPKYAFPSPVPSISMLVAITARGPRVGPKPSCTDAEHAGANAPTPRDRHARPPAMHTGEATPRRLTSSEGAWFARRVASMQHTARPEHPHPTHSARPSKALPTR